MMDLSAGEMGFIFCGKLPLRMTRTRVSDPVSYGLIVINSYFNISSLNLLCELASVSNRSLNFRDFTVDLCKFNGVCITGVNQGDKCDQVHLVYIG